MALPSITNDIVDSVFARLDLMEVELDPDPLEYGPKRLNGKIAQARGMLNGCEKQFLQVSHWLQQYKRANRAAVLEFDLLMQDMLANDPEVKAGLSVRDRDAIATIKVRTERETISKMEIVIQDLEAMMQVIKAKRADLRDIQSRLRDQIKLCQEEIGLGSRWGSRPPPGTRAPNLEETPDIDAESLQDLQEMFSGVGEKEMDFSEVVKPPPPVEDDEMEAPPRLDSENIALIDIDELLNDL